jgi:N-acyl-D-amino-acid deacylase
MNPFDFLFCNVRLIDGNGTPSYHADLALRGNQIEAIGDLVRFGATEMIDGKGGFLAPGFIDTHTHDDVAVLNDRLHPSKLLQGVTTVVVGNCGFSSYPSDGPSQTGRHLGSLLGEVRPEQLFADFKSYRKAIDSEGLGLNLVSLVGHGPLRVMVMDYDKREPTAAELDRMCQLLETQLQQGAAGLSLGLAYPPSAYAVQHELIRLCSLLKRYNRLLAAHIRSYEGALFEAMDEFLELLTLSGVKGLLSHLQVAGRPYWGKMGSALAKIEEARRNGLDVGIDMYPYPAGSSTILQLLPPSAQQGGIDALIDRLDSAGHRETIGRLVESGREPGWESKIASIGWENVRLASITNPNLKIHEGKSIAKAAMDVHLTPLELTFDLVQLDEGKTNIIMFQQSEEDLMTVHRSRDLMVGSDSIPRADGKPHPRMFGSFPRVIGRLAMKERLIPVEQAVRRATSLPAERFQLARRGLLRAGYLADLVLFDDDFLDRATFDEPQLSPSGLMGVWVSGVRVVENNQPTGRRPGRVLTAGEG